MCGSIGGAPVTAAISTPTPTVGGGGSVTIKATQDFSVIAGPAAAAASMQPVADAVNGTTAGAATAANVAGGGAAGAAPAMHHEPTIHKRTKPKDMPKAKQVLKATMSMFGKMDRSNSALQFESTGTHGRLSPAARAAFKKRYPKLPAPSAVVFAKNGTVPLGVVYNEREGKYDLGAGLKHTHMEKPGMMQHVWFTPKDLKLAFSDVTKGSKQKVLEQRDPTAAAALKAEWAAKAGTTVAPAPNQNPAQASFTTGPGMDPLSLPAAPPAPAAPAPATPAPPAPAHSAGHSH